MPRQWTGPTWEPDRTDSPVLELNLWNQRTALDSNFSKPVVNGQFLIPRWVPPAWTMLTLTNDRKNPFLFSIDSHDISQKSNSLLMKKLEESFLYLILLDLSLWLFDFRIRDYGMKSMVGENCSRSAPGSNHPLSNSSKIGSAKVFMVHPRKKPIQTRPEFYLQNSRTHHMS